MSRFVRGKCNLTYRTRYYELRDEDAFVTIKLFFKIVYNKQKIWEQINAVGENKTWISFIFYKFLEIIGWAKSIIQGVSGLYDILSTIDLTKILCGEHPAEIFFHWLLLSHPLRIFLFTQIILLFFAVAKYGHRNVF